MVDCACDEEADIVVLPPNEKPVKEPPVPEGVAVLATPKPVKELAAEAELVGAGAEVVVVVAEELLKLKLGSAVVEAAEAVVVLAAGVETLVVVTVENKGAVDVLKDSEVGFVAAEEAALLKLKEG